MLNFHCLHGGIFALIRRSRLVKHSPTVCFCSCSRFTAPRPTGRSPTLGGCLVFCRRRFQLVLKAAVPCVHVRVCLKTTTKQTPPLGDWIITSHFASAQFQS